MCEFFFSFPARSHIDSVFSRIIFLIERKNFFSSFFFFFFFFVFLLTDDAWDSVFKLDSDFTGKLWESYLKVKATGLTQHLTLGLFRSDYIVDKHAEGYQGSAAIKQIEFNTVSISFGALSSKISQLHTYLSESGTYGETGKHIEPSVSDSLVKLSDGLAVAHKEYVATASPAGKTAVLFVVQPGERNVFDQRHLEYRLYEAYGIISYRLTLAEIREHTKYVKDAAAGFTRLVHTASGAEISLVYYRSGYAPTDYPSETEWDARVYLESTHAIKCPSLLTQISGSKKIQQILTDPAVIRQFIPETESALVDQLEATFVKIHPMDNSPAGLKAREAAFATPERFVLKPQREGGGNNIYKENIPDFLRSTPEDTWGAYILMELIVPPDFKNKILRAGEIYDGEIISELGVFGTALWNQQTSEIKHNEQAGWLLRSKLKSSNEGGVAAGFGCIDSVYLF